jgi:lysozyme
MPDSVTTSENLNAALRLSAEGRNAMRSPTREGVVNGYYNDGGKTRGNCTFGVGIKVHDGPCSAEQLKRPLTPVQVEAAFGSAVVWAENGIKRHVRKQPLTQEQFDALVSFVFNVGVGRSITVLHRIDHGELDQATAMMTSMNTSKQNGKPVFMPGLVRRRREETAPFRSKP